MKDITLGFRTGLFLLVLVAVVAGKGLAAEARGKDKVVVVGGDSFFIKPISELNSMEVTANEARKRFWRGEYHPARDAFRDLNEQKHSSSPLYLLEMGICELAAGDHTAAARDLTQASIFAELFRNQQLEKKSASAYGYEGQKIFFGDPQERAINYLILAMLAIGQGDVDNALAACKSGLLADSDSADNHYESDLALLYFLEAKCHLLRNQGDAAETTLGKAVECYRLTHPSVRSAFSARMDQIELLKLSAKERKKLGVLEQDDVIRRRIESLEGEVKESAKHVAVDRELGLLRSGSYNTLILVPRGQSPEKAHAGKEAEMIIFNEKVAPSQFASVRVDGQEVTAGMVTNVCDINFQATTRGGRKMDAILKGKAVSKSTTVGVGQAITDVGTAVGGEIGLLMALVGAGVQSAGAAISPQADARCWRCLPYEYGVYALELPEGEHDVVCEQFLYFERIYSVSRRINVRSNAVQTVFAPPPPIERYSGEELREKSKSNLPELLERKLQNTVLLVPPLGLKRIEFFPSDDQKKNPHGVAPDPHRIARKIRDDLTNVCTLVWIDHYDAVANRAQLMTLSKVALQMELSGLSWEKAGKDDVYSATFSFNIVSTADGTKRYSKSHTGHSRQAAKGMEICTKAFYECLGKAVQSLAADPQFAEGLRALLTQ